MWGKKRALIKRLEIEANHLRDELSREKEKSEFYKKRFMDLGSLIETDDGVKPLYYEIKPEQWGNWCMCCNSTEIDNEMIRLIKERITESIVEGIIDRNLAQIIVKHDDEMGLPGRTRVGMKLFVIPWEKMARRSTINVQNYIRETITKEDVIHDQERKN